MARVSTYLTFDGRTEEAFEFYRSVFGGEFTGGIHRFADAPPASPEQQCGAMSETDKTLILHVELPILGGHVLMGTDAPKSMGFTLVEGNNLNINLEPDSRAETTRLFEALSAGGKIDMPLADMFWGAYFGNVTDKFGIHWMFNCSSKT